ncbi:CHAT domain-containing protein [Streptomyces sp. NPDC052701]|uniref:CHAT domain-containing protein n=1 Tax=Streptomyces sp. NPDC052701 TaxID=3155533 RepID=UPI003448E41E
MTRREDPLTAGLLRASEALGRFHAAGDPDALDLAVRLLTAVTSAAPDGHPALAEALGVLGTAYTLRYETDRRLGTLDLALAAFHRGLRVAPPGTPHHGTHLACIGSALSARYAHTGDPAVLRESLTWLERAARTLPADDPNAIGVLNTLGNDLQEWAQHQEHPAGALSTAVEHLRRAAGLASHGDHPGRLPVLNNLSVALHRLYRARGGRALLDEAITVQRQVVALTPAGSPVRAGRLWNLAARLRLRYEREGRAEDLEEMLGVLRVALAADPGDPDVQDALGAALLERYEASGREEDLEAAIAAHRRAVAQPDAGERVRHLLNLGKALHRKALRRQDAEALEEAMACYRDGLAAGTADLSLQGACWHNLGLAHLAGLASGWLRELRLADLEEGVACARRAVAADPHRPEFLVGLGEALSFVGGAGNDVAMVREAVTHFRRAVDLTAADDPRGDSRRVLLAQALGSLYRLDDRPETLDEAIAHCRRPASPSGHLVLGDLLLRRYGRDHGDDLTDLDQSLVHCRAAVDADPRPYALDRLAQALMLRYRKTLDPSVVPEFAAVARRAAKAARTEPWNTEGLLSAAIRLGTAHAATGDWQEAGRVLEHAVEVLLPRLTPRYAAPGSTLRTLGRYASLAPAAAGIAAGFGRAERAVELLEQGRGVLLGQLLDVRDDVEALRAHDAGLAEEFLELRERMAASEAEAAARHATLPGWLRRADGPMAYAPEAAEEFDAWVARIRSLPGLDRFLLPPTAGELRGHAAEGPVVMLYTSELGEAAALIVTSERVRAVGLGLNMNDVTVHALVFRGLTHLMSHGSVALRTLRELQRKADEELQWLWDRVTGPVLERLGLTAVPAPGAGRPRVWWIPVGVFALLPLHAAGHHAEPDGPRRRTVMDRVVSSYTPTIRALDHARRQEARRADREVRALVVSAPRVPGAAELPEAEREAAAVARRFPGAGVLAGDRADRDAVLRELGRASHVHFACHGLTDAADPSRSRLLVHGHQDRPLTVADLSRLRGTRTVPAELAYLSACETTRTPRVPDESVHITAALQVAGYPHVIGTLWNVEDRVAADLAEEFYARLPADGGPGLPPAAALHAAVRTLRDRYPHAPLLWAAHIHAGA